PTLPTPHCRTAHPGTAGHLQYWQPFGREQNNLGALHMLQRPIAITNDRSQMGTILVADEDTKLLRHAHIIPYPRPCESSVSVSALAKRRHNREQESAMITHPAAESSATPLDVKIEQMLTEARVILPGAQALFGFQLAIVFTRSFVGVPAVSMIVHAASLLLVILTVVLLMAPAAYHRLVYPGEASAGIF